MQDVTITVEIQMKNRKFLTKYIKHAQDSQIQ